MKDCMKIRHLNLLLFSIAILFAVKSANALTNSRNPQNYVPETDQHASYEDLSFSEDVWQNDHSGVLNQLRNRVTSWENIENYRLNYGLTNFDEGANPTVEQKRRQIEKGLLRYLDKRIMHKVKTAPKQSSLAKVRSAKKALRPSSTTEISKNFKLKFRAKLLRGRGSVILVNPWFDANAQFSLSGKMEFQLSKEFQASQLYTELKVNLHEDQWIALMQKNISESIKAQVLSIQSTDTMALDAADRRIQLLYQQNF